MPSITPRYNWGTELKNINVTLYNQLNDSYTTIARFINTKVYKNVNTVDPPADNASNATFDIGDIYVNSSTNTA